MTRLLRAASVVLLVAATAGLAGCDTCQPLMDVRHCAPGSTRCVPDAGDEVREWSAAWAAAWPDIAEHMDDLAVGDHGHEDWDEGRASAWWTAVGVEEDAPEKEAYFSHRGGMFRVRVLTC